LDYRLVLSSPWLSQLVKTQKVVTATLGEDAVLTCELMTPKDVRQVTWQKETPGPKENVATYSKRGPDVNVRFKGKVEFEDEGLQNCSIVIRGVSRGDESCYKCLFNTFPEGAISGTTCLHVNELYGPSLLITQTNNSHTTLSCSATGRPVPTVTWEDTEILENSTMANVTHLNGTVTVTITSTLAAFSLPDKDTRVGCMVSLFSGGVTKNVFMVIPGRTQASFPGPQQSPVHSKCVSTTLLDHPGRVVVMVTAYMQMSCIVALLFQYVICILYILGIPH
uniref:Ig-like domain-containing protein n=1 Tax=Oncorhynchus mykiss TaxID=8022 RepID=A0A8C7NYK7_ONCMY